MSVGKAVTIMGTNFVERHFKKRRMEGEEEEGTGRGEVSSCLSFPGPQLSWTWITSSTQLQLWSVQKN